MSHLSVNHLFRLATIDNNRIITYNPIAMKERFGEKVGKTKGFFAKTIKEHNTESMFFGIFFVNFHKLFQANDVEALKFGFYMASICLLYPVAKDGIIKPIVGGIKEKYSR